MSQLSSYSRHEFSVDGQNDSWSNLFAYVPAGSRVLDVGCSTGNFGEALEKLSGCAVTGIDLNPADIDVARKRITRAEVVDVSAPGALSTFGRFDCVVFADVLEHLIDPCSVLVEALSRLAPGGSVLFSIPNMAHLSVRLDLLEGRFGYTDVGILDKTHVHFYDRAAIDAMFAVSGFDVVEEKSVLSEYPPLWIAERLAGLGLAADATFTEMLSETDAGVLQFVGRAQPASVGVTVERTREFPPEEISAYARMIEDENIRLRAAIASAISKGEARQAELEEELRVVSDRLRFVREHPVRAIASSAARRIQHVPRRR